MKKSIYTLKMYDYTTKEEAQKDIPKMKLNGYTVKDEYQAENTYVVTYHKQTLLHNVTNRVKQFTLHPIIKGDNEMINLKAIEAMEHIKEMECFDVNNPCIEYVTDYKGFQLWRDNLLHQYIIRHCDFNMYMGINRLAFYITPCKAIKDVKALCTYIANNI